ncbi:unnamed protein product [Medioppia subpectinata]|uniref:Methyltransferase type 12 domain-containing protein n=1 Tax=Medioppia subpectinata TaxID=1979941 RepID=A0A7R9PWL8_9ACAR|nr:unnamed protein product [Medioppia subpectinata]CAG2103464.1 unnamed protein product [Medioppia subpectinata]
MAQQLTQIMASLVTTDVGEDEDNKQQLKIYAKNSMDRFGDDLCELLLSYLSLEDRFRYECVSKQFQRTVFVSVVDINIFKALKRIKSTEILTKMAKSCANIESIDCRGMWIYYEDIQAIPSISARIPEALAIFRDNCRHLREIHCDFLQNCDLLIERFGPLVTRITNMSSDGKQSLNSESQTHETVAQITSQLSRLTQLRELTLGWDLMNENSLSESLRTIVTSHSECLDHISRLPALKTLELLGVNGIDLRDSDIENLFSKNIIIDMGSGDGAVTKELATRVPHRQLVAIDVNPAMIEYSQRVNSLPTIEYAIQDLSLTWPELGPDVRLLEAKVDLIFSNHCFHYIRDKTRVLSICRRLLATGGTIHASILLLPDLNRKLPADRRKGWCLSVDQQLDVWRRAVADNGLTADVFEVFEEDYRFTRTQIIGQYFQT